MKINEPNESNEPDDNDNNQMMVQMIITTNQMYTTENNYVPEAKDKA